MLGMEREAKADDLVIEAPGVQVLVDPESAPLVEGAQIDYVDGLMRSGFVISNPNFQVAVAAADAHAVLAAADVAAVAAAAEVAAVVVVDAGVAATKPYKQI